MLISSPRTIALVAMGISEDSDRRVRMLGLLMIARLQWLVSSKYISQRDWGCIQIVRGVDYF